MSTLPPRIAAIAHAEPPHAVPQSLAREWARARFVEAFPDIDRLIGVFDNAGIEQRRFCVPPEWFFEEKGFGEKNDEFIRQATALGAQAAEQCLQKAGVEPDEIDYLIYVSTTGLATPSIDARLIGLLGIDPHTRRTPVWGLGCAGGVAGVSHAYHHLLGHPRQRVLLVAVELCGLTFHFRDLGKSNLVATSLFADGVAALLFEGGELPARPGAVEILDTRSTLWPDSLSVMGWNVHNEGMQVVFSRAIPGIVRQKSRENIESFLKSHDLALADIDHFVCHPGGVKVLEAYEQALALSPDKTAIARAILREWGNVSSVSVLLVLEKFLADGICAPGDLGLMTALGPGFSSEHALLRFAGQ